MCFQIYHIDSTHRENTKSFFLGAHGNKCTSVCVKYVFEENMNHIFILH